MTLFVMSLGLIGSYGIFFPKNILSFLMSIEIILLSATTHLVERLACGDLMIEGAIGILLLLTIAGADLAIGLAVIMRAFKNGDDLSIHSFHRLKEE